MVQCGAIYAGCSFFPINSLLEKIESTGSKSRIFAFSHICYFDIFYNAETVPRYGIMNDIFQYIVSDREWTCLSQTYGQNQFFILMM